MNFALVAAEADGCTEKTLEENTILALKAPELDESILLLIADRARILIKL